VLIEYNDGSASIEEHAGKCGSWLAARISVRLSPSARLALFRLGRRIPLVGPNPPGIFGYPPVSRQFARPFAVAGSG
jgi:hypothetical protein